MVSISDPSTQFIDTAKIFSISVANYFAAVTGLTCVPWVHQNQIDASNMGFISRLCRYFYHYIDVVLHPNFKVNNIIGGAHSSYRFRFVVSVGLLREDR